MLSNVNPKTGIRCGVISARSLDPEVEADLFYGAQARDVTFEEARNERQKDAAKEWEGFVEEAEIAAAETDSHMSESAREEFIENWLVEKTGFTDEDYYVDAEVQHFCDMFECDTPHIEGEADGVKYEITWLGGAPLVWVLEGPVGWANRLCSPCVPNAADLDGGFLEAPDPNEELPDDGPTYMCYVVPRDWLRQEDE